MIHSDFSPTPLSHITNCLTGIYPDREGGVIFKRDDLFYNSGGGSKARMLQYILSAERVKDAEVIVTAGGPMSNFNRACALKCAESGLKMHLITYTDHEEEFNNSLNYFLVRMTSCTITRCKKTEVADTIASVMRFYEKNGVKAVNIYGGGRSIEGIYSYFDAVKELSTQLKDKNLPLEVFVACGTGTTVSGISAGLQRFFPQARVHAISVARDKTTEMPIIYENLESLNYYLRRDEFTGSNIRFHDQFILGEYGAVNDELITTIRTFVSETGILLDPVYTGKAFYGMLKILKSEDINDNIVFWHTGAVYTLLSHRHLFENG